MHSLQLQQKQNRYRERALTDMGVTEMHRQKTIVSTFELISPEQVEIKCRLNYLHLSKQYAKQNKT